MRYLLPVLAVLLCAACEKAAPSKDKPPPAPDWAQVERLLASEVREDRGYGLQLMLVADEDDPGVMDRLAEMPEDASPALRHYSAANLLLTLRNQPGALPNHRAWTPTPKTLRLLIQGLEDERPLPLSWDIPIGRFCQDALELLTGRDSPPRPINRLPTRKDTAEWMAWWEENRRFLCWDAERGILAVDPAAKGAQTPIVPE